MELRVAMWCPSGEGHLVYTSQLVHALDALHPVSPDLGCATTLLTTHPLPSEHTGAPCRIEYVGKRIRSREQLGATWRWILDRMTYHPRRELGLLRWLWKHPDHGLVHLQEIHEVTGPVVAWVIRRVLRRRVVFTMHNVLSHRRRGPVARAIEVAWTRKLLAQADAVIAHSEHLRQRLACVYQLPLDRIEVIPIGVPISRAADRPRKEVEGHVDGRAVRLLFYGTIRANKGLHHLLDCFEASPSDWSLRIAGSILEPEYFATEVEPRIRRLAEAGRRIEFRPGYVPEADVPEHFAWASLVVLPYVGFEAQSGVLLDAIVHRTPVVVTAEGALAETVQEFGFGVVAGSSAPSALQVAIRECLALDSDALTEAWRRIDDALSLERMALRTREVYLRLAE